MFLPSYFSIFLCVMQKTLKPSKKLSIPRMDEKKLHTLEFQLKGAGENMRCFKKKSTEKPTVFQTLATYHHWKRYFFRT